jgi:hypothetical protein
LDSLSREACPMFYTGKTFLFDSCNQYTIF